jgi:hypothetical protein
VNIHTTLVGAFEPIILCLSAGLTVVMLVTLLNLSLDPADLLAKRGTVTIQQLALDDTGVGTRDDTVTMHRM